MYTFNSTTGEVVRDADGVVVSPCQSAEDPDFLAYVAWINEGNSPAVVEG
jgi:hypothetical protein